MGMKLADRKDRRNIDINIPGMDIDAEADFRKSALRRKKQARKMQLIADKKSAAQKLRAQQDQQERDLADINLALRPKHGGDREHTHH